MSDLRDMGHQAYAVNWVAAACMTALIYDHTITLGQEVSRIWTMRWRLAKFLFLLNRYVVSPMIVFNSIASAHVNPAPKFCTFYLRWLAVTLTVSTFAVEGILTLRIWALYENNKIVAYSAVFLYFSCIATLVGLTVRDYVGESVLIVDDFSALPGCYAAAVPDILAGYWITPVTVESIFFIMTTWRTVNWFRESGSVPPTLRLLARDSVIYFFLVFALLLANLLVFEFGPPFLSSLLVTPSMTVGCIAGTRMLLNLRGYAENNARNGGRVGAGAGHQLTAESFAMRQRMRFATPNATGRATAGWRSGVAAGSVRATETFGGTPRLFKVAGDEEAYGSWLELERNRARRRNYEWRWR